VESSIDTNGFKTELELATSRLTEAERLRALKCISYLEAGAPAFQRDVLGPCSVKNSKEAVKYGAEVTDSIASWIKKGFVAGPFESPPPE
jgi:hypothetical protein